MPPTREFAIASVRVYDEKLGDPVLTDRGFGWLNVLERSHRKLSHNLGSVSYAPNTEFVPEMGLMGRPYIVPQDTLLSQYTVTPSGVDTTWEQVRPIGGRYRTYRLKQYSADPDLQYSAISTFAFPANSDFAFSVILADTPGDWNSSLEPYVRCEFGGGTWAIHLEKSAAYLLRYDNYSGTGWQAVMKLSMPGKGMGYVDNDEIFVMVRTYLGKLGVSMDFGYSWEWYQNPDKRFPVDVPSGSIGFRGQGGQAVFGFHQIAYYQGSTDTGRRNTFTSRLTGVASTITGRYWAPPMGGVSFTDLSSPTEKLAQYRIGLTPQFTPGYPFGSYKTPVVGNVTFQYPPVPAPQAGTYTTPWNQWLLAVDVVEPYEIDGGSCTIRFHRNAASSFSDSYRFRKIQVLLGYKLSDGSEEWVISFTGYIDEIDREWNDRELNGTTVMVKALNMAERFRRTEWFHTDIVALGGNTPNVCGDFILASEGLNTTYRSWYASGGIIPLPTGSWNNPFEVLKPGEKKWQTLKRVFGYRDLEVGVSKDGIFLTLPFGYWDSSVAWTFDATSQTETDIRRMIRKLGVRKDYKQGATAVIVTADDQEDEEMLMVYAIDGFAEQSTLSGRFCPWRDPIQESVQGSCNFALVLGKCQSLANQFFGVPIEADLAVPINPTLVRRNRIEFQGCSAVDIADGANYGILSLHHSYRAGESWSDLDTTSLLKFLNN